jgi:hypothetical protein
MVTPFYGPRETGVLTSCTTKVQLNTVKLSAVLDVRHSTCTFSAV